MDNGADGLQIRAIRLALGMTQAEFGVALGLSRVHVGLMERGQKCVSHRTILAANSLRPEPLNQDPSEFDPVFRGVELALINNGVDYTRQFRSDGQTFDFFLPEFELAICIERAVAREVRPTGHVRGIICVTGKSAAEILVLALNGRPLRASRPMKSPIEA